MWTRDDSKFPSWLDVDWKPRKSLSREGRAAYETFAKAKLIQKKREYLDMLRKSHNILDEAVKLVHANFRTISKNVPKSLAVHTEGLAAMKAKTTKQGSGGKKVGLGKGRPANGTCSQNNPNRGPNKGPAKRPRGPSSGYSSTDEAKKQRTSSPAGNRKGGASYADASDPDGSLRDAARVQ